VTLPVFAAARHAAARLLLTADLPAVQQLINISWPPGPQQQTRRSGVWLPNVATDRQTDGRAPYRYIDPAPHTMRAVRITPTGINNNSSPKN